jgi:ATP-dependent helicase/nuclease subunit A
MNNFHQDPTSHDILQPGIPDASGLAKNGPVVDESVRELIRGMADFEYPVLLDPAIRLNETIVVRAGAGSGKTSVLVDRMLALVRQGVSLDKIVAITFTKKASGELQERFFERLLSSKEQLLAKLRFSENGTAWTRECGFVDTAIEDAEHIFIGTIHGFCAQLLRSNALDLGIPPEFEQIDDRDEEKLRETYWIRFLNISSAENDPDLVVLQDAGVSLESLFGLFGTLSKNSSAEFSLSGSPQPELEETFHKFATYVTTISARVPSGNPDGFITEIERLSAMFAAFDCSDPFVQLRLLRTATRMVSGKDAQTFDIKVTYWGSVKTEPRLLAGDLLKGKEELGFAKPFLNFVLEDVVPIVQKFDHFLHDRALSLCNRSVEGYRLFRLQSGRLTYDDLLAEALNLVRDVSSARSHFQTRFSHILIDEFQDTDPIQAAMLFSIASKTINRLDWSKSVLIPGMLFFVGDDKQSIYRFRKADFQAFHLVREAVKSQNGLDLKLIVNFRSDKRICQWVNDSVGDLFKESEAPFQAPWENLTAYHDNLGLVPVVHFKVQKSPIRSQYPKVLGECAAILEHIQNVLRADAPGTLNYGSFLILVRRHANIPQYVAALTQAGIPVGVTGGKAEAISDVLAWLDDLLRAVYDPNDGVALVSTLRGPFFGISDQELFDYVQTGGVLSSLADEPDKSLLAPSLSVAALMLENIRDLFQSCPPHQAFEKVLSITGIEAMLRTRVDSDLTSGMLQRVLELFREWESRDFTFGQCVEDFRLYRRGKLSLESFSESVPYGACVRIMTTHQAKGLQAEVVFLADTGGKEPPDSTLHTHRVGPKVIGMTPLVKKSGFHTSIEIEPAGWTEALALERLFDAAERKRLLYVACTRAERQLVISTNELPGKGPWDDLSRFLAMDGVEQVLVPPVMDIEDWITHNPTSSGRDQNLVISTGDTGISKDSEEDPWIQEAVQERIDALTKPSWKVRRPSEKESELGGIPAKGSSSGLGMEYGSAIHALFESLIARRRSHTTKFAITEWVKKVMYDRFSSSDSHRLLESSMEAALAFYESDLWTEITNANRVLTEVPFTVTEVIDELEYVVSGVVDLAFRTEAGWFIVDYKTDRVAEIVLRERHESQLGTYHRAWSQIFTDEACEVSIWSTHLNRRIVLNQTS